MYIYKRNCCDHMFYGFLCLQCLKGDMLKNDWKMIHDSDPILHQAAFVGDLERLQMLIEESGHKKILDAKNRLGCTALRLAATSRSHCLLDLKNTYSKQHSQNFCSCLSHVLGNCLFGKGMVISLKKS